jgi:glycosyltransferase involved in cell wall biosynthesis
MRVAFVSGTWPYRWAPTEWLWGRAATAALAAGHQVLVSVFDGPLPAEVQQLADAGAEVHRRRFVRHLAVQRRLDRWAFPFRPVVRFRPDVIVLIHAGVDDFAVNYPPAAIRRLTADWATPHVVVCNYNDDGYVPAAAARTAGRAVFGRAARVVTFSANNLAAYRRQLAHPLPNGRVLKNPVNLPSLDPVPWPTPTDPAFGFVGRLDARHKGLDLLLEALGGDRWKSRAWRLNLYGDGPDRGYLTELAALYGIADRLTFHGFTADIRGAWAANHLCLSPSRAEAMPIALWEGLICGRPAVATDCGAAREWVIEGTTGYLAGGPTAGAIADALERAWADRDRWPRVGAAAHAHTAPLVDPDPGRTLLNTLIEAAG